MRAYTHLGSVIEARGALSFDIRRRLKQAHHAGKPLAKPVFKAEDVPLAVRACLFRSLVLSRCTHNIGAWKGLNKSEATQWQSGCLQLYKYLLPSGCFDKHLTASQICRMTAMLPPLILLRMERLHLVGQVAAKSLASLNQPLESALGNAVCWLTVLQQDLDWLFKLRPTCIACEMRSLELSELILRFRSQPSLMSSLLNAIWHRATLDLAASHFVAFTPAAHQGLMCPQCGFSCKDRRGLHTHLAIKHGRKIEARYFARGCRCEAWFRILPSRSHLTKHLSRRSPKCLDFLRSHKLPMSSEEERIATTQAALAAKKPKVSDLCRAHFAP